VKSLIYLLIAGVISSLSAFTQSQTLEQELENWKSSSLPIKRDKVTPQLKQTIPLDSMSDIARVEEINPDELFSNKVSDPKIRKILEEAYNKPNAVIIHATVY
jgi:predicted nucleic acid-binding protein